MSESTEIEYLLTVSVEDCVAGFRQLERILFRSLSLMRRMGLPENVDEAVSKIQQLIFILRSLQITIRLTQAALLSMGPLGIATAGLAGIGTLVSIGDFIESDLRGIM